MDPKKRPKLNDGIWIDQDRLVATAIVGENQQNRIKIWNSENGNLVHILQHHTEHIQNLKPHPLYGSIFVSSGCDGLVVLWDAIRGTKLGEVYFPTTVESNEPISVHDIRWSHDGMQIACCDSQGQRLK